jgi:large subunit ribosomal protein L9
MKVVLLADVYNHGVAGEVVTVADGFARNWLLPKKLAVKANPGELKKLEALRASSAARKAALEGRLNELAQQINGVELLFGRRASPTGKLFGSVTSTEIAEALNQKTGIDINRRRISQLALREIGTHDVPVRIGSDISPLLKVIIVREDEYARILAGGAMPAQVEEAVADDAAPEQVVVDEAETEVQAEAESAAE